MDTARLFQSGRSQAVRLPKAYRFSGTEVIVKHLGNGVLLLPIEDPWQTLEAGLAALGQAMLEACIYDKESGQLLTGSYMDYVMPRADDLPDIEIDLLEIPCASNPLGVKGAGEAGAVGSPPAIINAMSRAIGARLREIPATPERVLRAMMHRRNDE